MENNVASTQVKRSHKAEKVLERMSKKLTRQMVGSLAACVHCGMCTEACHYVLTHPDDPT
jgi:heterodisulfide reductase subunit C